jgi:predicted PurR-regulated permease PerM
VIQSSTSTVVATSIFIATLVIFITVTISAFVQAKRMNESINNFGLLGNQTTQNMTHSATQTEEQVQQDANQTNEASECHRCWL